MSSHPTPLNALAGGREVEGHKVGSFELFGNSHGSCRVARLLGRGRCGVGEMRWGSGGVLWAFFCMRWDETSVESGGFTTSTPLEDAWIAGKDGGWS